MHAAATVSTPRFDLRERPCPTCVTEANRTLGLRGGAHHRYGLGVTTRIVQCQRCQLIFPNPFPYAVSLAELYTDETFAPPEPRCVDNAQSDLKGGRRWFPAEPASLLDVGCGHGYMLAAAKREGFTRVVGLEIAE